MKVKLEEYFSLKLLIASIRCCYQSEEKSDSYYVTTDNSHFHLGDKDKKLINSIINNGHDSTLEHIVFHFNIGGISRLCLQELARHRVASFSVKSTRYTLKELKNELPFHINDENTRKRASKYIKLINNILVDAYSLCALDKVRECLLNGESIDKVKYCLPECYLTNLHMTINLRSLRNFLDLRTSNRAHFEIRELANKIAKALPKEYNFLIKDCLHEQE